MSTSIGSVSDISCLFLLFSEIAIACVFSDWAHLIAGGFGFGTAPASTGLEFSNVGPVKGIGLCSQCGIVIVIDKKSEDSTCCSFSQTWWSQGKMYAPEMNGKCKKCKRTGEDHRKTRRGQGVYNLCYHPDWAKGYDECCCNCAKDKGWSIDGYEEYGCEQCKNKLRLVKASDGIANLI
jgi:hypothetical protein